MWDKKRKNKFNTKTATYKGVTYHSRLEAQAAENLDWRIHCGEVKSWTGQHKFDIRVEGQHVCNYYIDFRVELTSGEVEYLEIKGFQTDLWKLKWKLTQILFDQLTKGETAHLVVNGRRIKSSYDT